MSHLQEGQKAPAFQGKDQDGKTIRLKDFAGKKLVLYFYPQDDTPTCTVQACNLRDNYEALQAAGYAVLGVSPDTVEKHKKFGTKHALPFPLLADVERKVIDLYGVWGEKQMYGRKYEGLIRTTFVIDEKGIIESIIRKPKSKQHAEEVMG
ncbi:MAG: thioredoxin-dependent thiol peroxidase [Hydrotalea sp.]|nr:thioredoxin-dependent thiol peroxidase [Hydrotalea sp.]